MTSLIANRPQPGARVQVIGAGLPRTGTNSFCAALSILLEGPAYHTGVQTALGDDESHVLKWNEVLKKRRSASPEDRKEALALMDSMLDGFVATSDPPLSQLVPELMELYPDAKVICSTRDMDSWTTSMLSVSQTVHLPTLKFLFFWIPNLRYLTPLWTNVQREFRERYGTNAHAEEDAHRVYENHHAWLKSIVPKDKLYYFDVRDGWEPLCKILDVPVPEGKPFPRLNDKSDFANLFKNYAVQGLARWAVAVSVVGVAGFGLWRYLPRR